MLSASDVFVAAVCVYLLSAGRSEPFGDAVPMSQAASHFVRHGSFAIPAPWPLNTPPGPDGVAALLASLVHLPGAALQAALGALAPDRADAFATITLRLGPLFAGAAVPAVLFRLLGRLGYSRRAAAWTRAGAREIEGETLTEARIIGQHTRLFYLSSMIPRSPKVTVKSAPGAVAFYEKLGFLTAGPMSEFKGIRFVPMEREFGV